MVYTPSGYYGCGASARYSTSTSDSSGINGLKLRACSADDQSDSFDVTVEEGFEGDWSESGDCSEGYYMIGT